MSQLFGLPEATQRGPGVGYPGKFAVAVLFFGLTIRRNGN